MVYQILEMAVLVSCLEASFVVPEKTEVDEHMKLP